MQPKEVTVLVGTNDLSKGGERYKVNKLIPHDDYRDFRIGEDIELILVEGSIKFNNRVKSIEYSSTPVKSNSTLRLSKCCAVTLLITYFR